MQVAIVRTEYVEVPDAMVAVLKAWIKDNKAAGRHIAVPVIKSIRDALKVGLKEAKDLYDTLNAEVAKETRPVW